MSPRVCGCWTQVAPCWDARCRKRGVHGARVRVGMWDEGCVIQGENGGAGCRNAGCAVQMQSRAWAEGQGAGSPTRSPARKGTMARVQAKSKQLEAPRGMVQVRSLWETRRSAVPRRPALPHQRPPAWPATPPSPQAAWAAANPASEAPVLRIRPVRSFPKGAVSWRPASVTGWGVWLSAWACMAT